MPSFLSPLLKRPDERHRLVNQRNGTVLASMLMTAFDSSSRRTGLLNHAVMPHDAAMIIAPCNAVHTIRMRFDIDIAFVSREGRVVKVRHAVKPWRMAAALGAFAAIELPAGALAQSETIPGDTIVVAESPVSPS
jgi:hypothetical protein